MFFPLHNNRVSSTQRLFASAHFVFARWGGNVTLWQNADHLAQFCLAWVRYVKTSRTSGSGVRYWPRGHRAPAACQAAGQRRAPWGADCAPADMQAHSEDTTGETGHQRTSGRSLSPFQTGMGKLNVYSLHYCSDRHSQWNLMGDHGRDVGGKWFSHEWPSHSPSLPKRNPSPCQPPRALAGLVCDVTQTLLYQQQ